ncbi:hypothetical protein [Actinoplanes sp. NBRC 101535]|uniref:DUF7701 domain-containing protein n=1 Tax=Actinoplanes sp. NBRC 101535 TaxID=3032196 RepID=UPI0024A06D71|nr:hypothetical protein [Actinoplanes sp. NBRC 101535]GLY08286.1 hypothetical protein Acsp01_86650 [Actinoplanes sp. NBRC 101535]
MNTSTQTATTPTGLNYVQQITRDLTTQLPDCDTHLIGFYALLALTHGQDTTLEHVHDAWALWRISTRPDHPDLILFDQLTPEVQELDRPYMQAIHQAAARVAAA